MIRGWRACLAVPMLVVGCASAPSIAVDSTEAKPTSLAVAEDTPPFLAIAAASCVSKDDSRGLWPSRCQECPPPEWGLRVLPSPVRATVLASDDAVDLHFISAGSKDGLKWGDVLTVTRDGHFVAEVVVDKCFYDRATVAPRLVHRLPVKKLDIRRGDRVSNGL
jgi:hypothetical protein